MQKPLDIIFCRLENSFGLKTTKNHKNRHSRAIKFHILPIFDSLTIDLDNLKSCIGVIVDLETIGNNIH